MRPEIIERVRGRDRHGEHQVPRPAFVQRLERRAHGATRRDAVIDDDDGAVADIDGAPALPVRANAFGHLALFLGDERFELRLRRADELHRVAVDVDRPLLRHRADAELRLDGCADLAHDAHVERGSERSSHFVRDRNSSPR